MKSGYIRWFLWFGSVWIFHINPALAQQTEKFKLVDMISFEPIARASFEYDNQKGYSAEDGELVFQYKPGSRMKLSHVGYGDWEIPDQAIRTAMEHGWYYREKQTIDLYPVTIIALRPLSRESESLQMDYQDKLVHDGGAILSRTPTINGIRKSGQYGFDPVMRGFKYDQLNIVMNGAQSATAACPNRMDPPSSQMAPNMMDRVEILKGPHALRFGNALGGTINFVPAAPRFSDSPHYYGRWSGGYDGNGRVLRSEALVGKVGSTYDLGLFASWSEGDDYQAGNGTTIPSDFQRGSFGALLGIKLPQHQRLKVSVSRNLARNVDFPALQMDLRKDDTWMLNGRHEILFASGMLKSWKTDLFGSFVDHRMDNGLKPIQPRNVNAEATANTSNIGGRTEGYWESGSGRLYAGLDLKVESAEGNRIRTMLLGPNAGKSFTDNLWQDARISKTGIFAEYHLRKRRSQLILAGRLELNKPVIGKMAPEFDQAVPEPAKSRINPGISLGLNQDAGKNLQLGFWLGRVQRSGGLTELFINYFPVGQDAYEMLGNPALKPEINNQFDFTIDFKSNKTALKIDLFTAYLQSSISSVIDRSLSPRLATSPGVRRYINIEEAFKTGLEFSWQQHVIAGIKNQLSLAYTYAQDLENDRPLPEIAPLDFRWAMSGLFIKSKLRAELSFRQVLKQFRVSNEFGERTTPGFSLMDIRTDYTLNRNLSMTAGIQNIFDVTYYEHLSRPMAINLPQPVYAQGRNFFLSMNVAFSNKNHSKS